MYLGSYKQSILLILATIAKLLNFNVPEAGWQEMCGSVKNSVKL